MSSAVGRESPAVLAVLASMPIVGRGLVAGLAAGHRCRDSGVAGDIQGRGRRLFAGPIMKPPGFTLLVVWHPEPLQSSEPIGM